MLITGNLYWCRMCEPACQWSNGHVDISAVWVGNVGTVSDCGTGWHRWLLRELLRCIHCFIIGSDMFRVLGGREAFSPIQNTIVQAIWWSNRAEISVSSARCIHKQPERGRTWRRDCSLDWSYEDKSILQQERGEFPPTACFINFP